MEVAKVTGAVAKNAGRFEGRAEPDVPPLGLPPEHLEGLELEAWNLFASEMPWLAASDRTILESACLLRAKQLEGSLSMAAMTELRQTLNALGGTPAARSKVHAPDPEDKDPIDEFVN